MGVAIAYSPALPMGHSKKPQNGTLCHKIGLLIGQGSANNRGGVFFKQFDKKA